MVPTMRNSDPTLLEKALAAETEKVFFGEKLPV
jgi:hypothetical protein